MKGTPLVKNQGTKQREQRTLGDCWQWKVIGSVLKETIAVSVIISKKSAKSTPAESFSELFYAGKMREMHREPAVPVARVPVVECLDGPARITSKELAPILSVKSGILQKCLFYKSESGCGLGKKCSCAHRPVEEQPSKRSKKNHNTSAVAMLKKDEQHDRTGQLVKNASLSNTRHLGCVFQDMEPPKSILRKSTDIRKPIQRVKFTNAIVRRAKKSRPKSFARKNFPGEPHQRSSNAPKFEDRSQEETEVPAKQRGSWPKVF